MTLSSLKSRALRKLAIRANVVYSADLHVGPRSVVWAPSRLSIGRAVYIGKNVTIEVNGRIGDGVLVANNVGIIGRTDHDMTQVGVAIRDARWVGDFPEELGSETIIGSDVWIGFGAIVLSGVSIGDSAVIAAGALVTRNVPPNSIVAGSPASIVRDRFDASSLEEHWSILRQNGYRIAEQPEDNLL